jgi:2-oxoisovalerate dehydrogenase E1 component alpha subunit
MCRLNALDTVFYDAQRQGRISFYMTSTGEEAATIGSAVALAPEDVVFAQYREPGVLLWRGFTLDEFANQCFSNVHDAGKGRQMPVHYGSRRLNFQTVSSPLTTQLPQAAGAAYALKREGRGAIVACYVGEGATSEGDFHAGLNMSATLECPVVFFCRNNGFAISTPTRDQYRGDGIASRGPGYGIHTLRVDGNDVLAVHEATRMARAYALRENKPVLIEAMSYRGGHHSTSDDSTRYRDASEIHGWAERNNPITRTRLFLQSRGWWDSDREVALLQSARKAVLAALTKAEGQKKPPITDVFSDVYDTMPAHLVRQQEEMYAHLAKYGEHYGLDTFADGGKR